MKKYTNNSKVTLDSLHIGQQVKIYSDENYFTHRHDYILGTIVSLTPEPGWWDLVIEDDLTHTKMYAELDDFVENGGSLYEV